MNSLDFSIQLQNLLFAKQQNKAACQHFHKRNKIYMLIFDACLLMTNIIFLIFTGSFQETELAAKQKISSYIYNYIALGVGSFIFVLEYFKCERILRINYYQMLCEGYYDIKINMDYFVILYLMISLEQMPCSRHLALLFVLLLFLMNTLYLFLTITSEKKVILSHKIFFYTIAALYCISLIFSYLLFNSNNLNNRSYIHFFIIEVIKIPFFLVLIILHEVKYICLSLEDLTEANFFDIQLYQKLVQLLLIKHDSNENGLVVIKNGKQTVSTSKFFNSAIEFLINRKDNYTKIISQPGRDFSQKFMSFLCSLDKDTSSLMMTGMGQGHGQFSSKKLTSPLFKEMNPGQEMQSAPRRMIHSSKNVRGNFEIERINNQNNPATKNNMKSSKMGTINEEDSEVNNYLWKQKRFSHMTLGMTGSNIEKKSGNTPEMLKTSSKGTAGTPFFANNKTIQKSIRNDYSGSIIPEEKDNPEEVSLDELNYKIYPVPTFLTKEAFKSTAGQSISPYDISINDLNKLATLKNVTNVLKHDSTIISNDGTKPKYNEERIKKIIKNENFESSNDSDSSGNSEIKPNEVNQAVLSGTEIENQLKQQRVEKENNTCKDITNSPVSPLGKLQLTTKKDKESNLKKAITTELTFSNLHNEAKAPERNPQESSSNVRIMHQNTKAYTKEKDKDKGKLETISSLRSKSESHHKLEVHNANTKDSKITFAQIQPGNTVTSGADKVSVHVNGDININFTINNNSNKEVEKNPDTFVRKKTRIFPVNENDEANDNDYNNTSVNQTDKNLIPKNVPTIFKRTEINTIKKSLTHDILVMPVKSDEIESNTIDLFKDKNANLGKDIILRLMTFQNALLVDKENVPVKIKDHIKSASNGVCINPFVEKLVGLFAENFQEEGIMETFGPFSLYLNSQENEDDRFNYTIGSQMRKCVTISLAKISSLGTSKANETKDCIVFVLFNEYNYNSNTLTFNTSLPRPKSSTRMSKIFAETNHEATGSPRNKMVNQCSNLTPNVTNQNNQSSYNNNTSSSNSNHNAVIGALMHDFKHLIQDHFFYVDYLFRKCMIQLPEEDSQYLEFMTSYSHSLIENLSAYLRNSDNFMKPGKDEMQYLDLVFLLELMEKIFKRRIGFINENTAQASLQKMVEVRLKIHDRENPCYKRVWTSRSMLMSLFYNILSNSYKYTQEGYIEIEASLFTSSIGHPNSDQRVNLSVSLNSNKSAKTYILVKVTDTGIGMSDHVRLNYGKAFNIEDPSKKESTGLGQFIIHKIREQLNICIPTPERGPNDKGTVIKMYIPCEEQVVIKKTNELYSILSVAKTIKNSELPSEDVKKFLSNSHTTLFYILIFDDESNQITAMLKRMKPILERTERIGIFFEIHTAITVDQFKKELEQVSQFHFFILDYNITTELNGVTVAEMVKMYYSVMHACDYQNLFCHFFFATEDAGGILEGMGELSRGRLMNQDNVFNHRQAEEIAEKIVGLVNPNG